MNVVNCYGPTLQSFDHCRFQHSAVCKKQVTFPFSSGLPPHTIKTHDEAIIVMNDKIDFDEVRPMIYIISLSAPGYFLPGRKKKVYTFHDLNFLIVIIMTS